MSIHKLSFLVACTALACTANVDQGPASTEAPATANAETPSELARLMAVKPAALAALSAAGFDPSKAETEANAIKDLSERDARLEAAKAWNDKYGDAIKAVIAPTTANGEAKLPPVLYTPHTLRGDLTTNPYTRCAAGGSASAPWIRAWPNDTFSARSSGVVSVLETGGFADGETSEAGMSGVIAVSPAEGELTVRGTINITDGWVEVWSTPPFGYANAGVGMRITVKSGSTVLCTRDQTITEFSVWGKSEIAPGPRTISCNFLKDAPIGALTVDVALRAWNAAGGAAGAHAQANGNVTSVTSTVCVEPGVLTNGQGSCIEPAGTTTPGAGVRPSECDGMLNQRWTFESTGRIQSNHVVGLCFRPNTAFGNILTLAACDSSAEQQFTRLSTGQLRWNANPALCVNAGAMGTFLTVATCASAGAVPTSQRLTFHAP
jgi:hypothetical protein